MKVIKNERLRKACLAENYVALATQWLESMAGEDQPAFQAAFLEDLYPACDLVGLEVRLPLEGFGGEYEVHVHMRFVDAVFSVTGRGNTYDAALFNCALDTEFSMDYGLNN